MGPSVPHHNLRKATGQTTDQLRKYGVPVRKEEKMQQYTEQIYFCRLFTKIEVRQWENKLNTNKTWVNTITYFETLYTKKYRYQEDVGAANSGFESATSFGKLKSQKQPFDGRSLRDSSIDTMPSLSSGAVGASARDKVWTDYVDTIEDLLLESKEFVASKTSAQDNLNNELEEECKQVKAVMAQNTKLMEMLETNICGR